MPESISTPSLPNTAAKQPPRKTEWHNPPEEQRRYLPMPWDTSPDTDQIPHALIPFVYDHSSGAITRIECSVEGDATNRAKQYVVAGSEAKPKYWPFTWFLTTPMVKEICEMSFRRGISVGEAMIRRVGREAVPPAYIKLVREGPQTYWKPSAEDDNSIQMGGRMTHGISVGQVFNAIHEHEPTPT